MAGLYGKCPHPHEDPNLTFGDLKRIVSYAVRGKLDRLQEKPDGQNVFFTINPKDKHALIARNKKHIKQGGLNKRSIEEIWSDNPFLKGLFLDVQHVLSRKFQFLSKNELGELFVKDGRPVWFSVEAISEEFVNVIDYNRDLVIFHENVVRQYDENGKLIDNFYDLIPHYDRIKTIFGPFPKQHSATSDWNVSLPFDMFFKGPEYLEWDVCEKISEVQAEIGASDKDPLRCCFHMNEIMDNTKKNIFDFSVDYLQGVQSKISLNQDTLYQIQNNLNKSIKSLMQDKNISEQRKQKLDEFLSWLPEKDLFALEQEIEGVTFQYKGNTYKLTGYFYPINQIMGLCTYGR